METFPVDFHFTQKLVVFVDPCIETRGFDVFERVQCRKGGEAQSKWNSLM
jgi:hypothetical protein